MRLFKALILALLTLINSPFLQAMEESEGSSSESTDVGSSSLFPMFFGTFIKDNLLTLIQHETERISMALYDLSDPDIINVLKKQAKKGCKIRIYIDSQIYAKTCTQNALDPLKKSKTVKILPIKPRYSGILFETMHEKMIFFQKQQCAWIGSYNLTADGPRQWNAAYITEDDKTLDCVLEELKRLRTNALGKSELVPYSSKKSAEKLSPQPLYFSPTSIPQLLLQLISEENSGVNAALFRFTYYPIANALTKRKHIREKQTPKDFVLDITVDKNFQQDHPEALRHLIEKKADVFYNTDRKIMHHKLWLFLKNRLRKPVIIMGSYNPTGQADRNWENARIIDDEDAVKACTKEFEKLAQCRAKMTLKDAIYTGSLPKSDYTKKMNGIPGY